MPEILQLKDFFITRLHVDWHEPVGGGRHLPQVHGGVAFDYDVLRKKDALRSFALRLRVKLKPKPAKSKAGYEIDSEIMGLFDFPESMEEQQMQALIRINGGTILYGILRGQIAAFTGSFPGGKLSLPPVYMQDIVEEVEKRKQAKHRKKYPVKRKHSPNG